MQGLVDEHPVWIFDYYTSRYTGGRTSRSYWFTAVYFRSQELTLPQFSMRPRRRASSESVEVGAETDPILASKYVLKGADEALVRRLFDEAKLVFFRTHAGLSVEGDGGQLVIYRLAGTRQQQLAEPESIPKLLDEALEVFSLLRS